MPSLIYSAVHRFYGRCESNNQLAVIRLGIIAVDNIGQKVHMENEFLFLFKYE